MHNRVCLIIMVSTIFWSCSNQLEEKTMIVASEEWQESRIICQIIKQVMAKKGVEVEIQRHDLEQIYGLMNTEEIDLFPDVWDNMHDVYTYDKAGFEDISSWYDGARLGIVAPAYLKGDSLWQYANDSTLYGNQFYSLESSAGVSIAARSVFKTYNMQPLIAEMSEVKMMDRVDMMIKKQQPFLFAGWEPHWMFSKYDLKYISDTTGNFSEPISIHMYGRAGFSSEFSDEIEVLKRIKLDRHQSNFLHNLTKGLETEEQYFLAIQSWLNEHPDAVNEWLKKPTVL